MSSSRFLVLCIAMLVATMVTGCQTVRIPSLSASVGRPQSQTGGAILISGSNFPANHTYGVGIFTTGSPRKIGDVATDSAGSINNVKLEYGCQSSFVGAINVEVYELVGPNLGAGIAQTKADRDACF
jgi:hypothetical protein